MAREQEKRCRGRDLEQRDRRFPIGALAFGQHVRKLVILHQTPLAVATQSESLVEAHEMGRRIDMHAQAGGFEDSAHEGDGRALAVGAAHMDDRRQAPLGVIERIEDAPHAVERKIDPLGMKRAQPLNDGIDGSHVAMGSSRMRAMQVGSSAKQDPTLWSKRVGSREELDPTYRVLPGRSACADDDGPR